MRIGRCGPAAAALWWICLASQALAQNLVVGESADPAFLNALPTPLVVEALTGPPLGPIGNARVSGQSIPSIEHRDVAIVDGQPIPFNLTVLPDGDDAVVSFTMGGVVIFPVVSPSPLSDAIFAADGLFIVAGSGRPGMIARADDLRLEVFTGSGGGISSVAQATGGRKPVSIVSLGGVSFQLGFVLTGRFTFFGTPEFPVSEFGASVQLRLVETGAEAADDSDFDGVPNEDDNCPVDANTNQSDRDMDELGDVCDACPDEAEPSEDLDGDGFGVLCDNCPADCLVIQDTEDGNCSNQSQTNSDDDAFGDVCDNCSMDTNPAQCCETVDPNNPYLCVPHPSGTLCSSDADCVGIGAERCQQPDTDGDREGDACEQPGVSATAQQPAPPQASVFLSPVTSVNGVASSFELKIKCGPRDLTTANIPFRIPTDVDLVRFGMCDQVDSADDPAEHILHCPPSGSELPTNVDPAGSRTRGVEISSPNTVGSDLFLITVTGTLTAGSKTNLLCKSTDAMSSDPAIRNRSLGVLTLEGLDSTNPNQPSIVTEQLNFFARDGLGRCIPPAGAEPEPDEVCTLVSEGDQPVPTSLTTTSFDTGSGVRVEVRPNVDAAFGGTIRSFQVSVLADQGVHLIAFGLTGFSGMTMDQVDFAGCDVPVDLAVAGYQVFGCRTFDDDPMPNPDLGPGVAGDGSNPDVPAFGDVPISYVLKPLTDGAPSGLAPDTIYAVLTGILGTQSNVNYPGQAALLGVFRYKEGAGIPPLPASLPQPVVTTVGVTGLEDADDFLGGTLLQAAVKFGVGATSGTVDSVGGAGSTPNSDGDTIADTLDNCKYVTNQAQLDDGRLLAFLTDKIGNVCQCGNSDQVNDGGIFLDDLSECAGFLAQGEAVSQNAKRCSVAGDGVFDIVDLTTLELVLSEAGGCRDPVVPPTGEEQPCFVDADCPGSGQQCLDKGTTTGVRIRQRCPQANAP